MGVATRYHEQSVQKVRTSMVWMKRPAVVVMLLIITLFALMAFVPASSAATVQQGPLIKVYFPKLSDGTVDHVYWVYRTLPSTGSTGVTTWTYSLQFIIAGPTLSERSTYGLYSEWNEILTGPSNCSNTPGGPDFTVTADHKGPKVAPGTETVKFCRSANPPGD